MDRFSEEVLPVSYTHLDVYKRQRVAVPKLKVTERSGIISISSSGLSGIILLPLHAANNMAIMKLPDNNHIYFKIIDSFILHSLIYNDGATS